MTAGQESHCWTPEQREAITLSGGHLLVSAAAGSGKTAVLVERVMHRITEGSDPLDIDRLLVVTFTEAAASEMRHRIGIALADKLRAQPRNAHLRRQLALLPRAPISTLHAFCRSLLRQYFYRADLDPRFTVLDEDEAYLLKQEAADAVLEEAYESAEPEDAFFTLASALADPSDDPRLRRLLLDLYDYSRSLPNPREWLTALQEAPFGNPPGSTAGAKVATVAAPGVDGAFAEAAPTAEGITQPFGTPDDVPWGGELRRYVHTETAFAIAAVQEALALSRAQGIPAYVAALTDDLEALLHAAAACADQPWEALRRVYLHLAFPSLGRARKEQGSLQARRRVQQLRKGAKERIGALQKALFAREPHELLAASAATAPIVRAAARLVSRLDTVYSAAKAQRSLVDFADLEHACLALLREPAPAGGWQPSAVARELRRRFAEVLVDEYQDINPVQDAILRLVARDPEKGGNLFVVGDVKQSIYRFRQADPGIFLNHYRQASADGPAPRRRIDLSTNFRSRRSIVAAVNFLFRQIMTPEAGEMAYSPEAELVYGSDYPAEDDLPVEVVLLDRKKEGDGEDEDEEEKSRRSPGNGGNETEEGTGETEGESLSALEREVAAVAFRIRRMLDDGAAVWDRDRRVYRPARLRDIVVLLRATRGKANTVVDMLARFGIPAYAELASGYFAATEVETMLSLLALLDNPRQDIPLAAVLRSPIVGLTAADLARVRLHAPGEFYDAVVAAADRAEEPELRERLRRFLNHLEEWRAAARHGSLADLIWTIYRETGYLDYAAAMPGGRQREANLRALHDRARQFDRFDRQGLSRFLRFVERLRRAEGDLGTPPAVGEDDDVVRVMSVHQSKGLEFPIVFLIDVGRPFRSSTADGALLLFDRELGIGAMDIDVEGAATYPTPTYLAVQERRRRQELAEEMRILYVALTRARERLVIVGTAANLSRACARWCSGLPASGWPLDPERIVTAASWLDWLGPVLCRHRDGHPLRELARRFLHDAAPADAGPPAGAAPVRSEDEIGNDIAHDPSRWHITFSVADARKDLTAEAEGLPSQRVSPPLPWEEIARGVPLPRGGDNAGSGPDGARRDGTTPVDVDGLIASLRDRLRWQYPWTPLTGKAAKVRASELKRRWDLNDDEARPASAADPFRRRPAWLHDVAATPLEPSPLTAAQRGIAVHTVLQHLCLREPLSEDGVRQQVEGMVRRGLLTEREAQAVDCRAVARFFESSLGRRLLAAPDRVLREVPFTLALPAAEAYPDLPEEVAAGEFVLTQGIIDVLLPEPATTLVIDFKTDAVAARDAVIAARRYAGQLALYRRAVQEMDPSRSVEAYIYFLTCGVAVAFNAL